MKKTVLLISLALAALFAISLIVSEPSNFVDTSSELSEKEKVEKIMDVYYDYLEEHTTPYPR